MVVLIKVKLILYFPLIAKMSQQQGVFYESAAKMAVRMDRRGKMIHFF